MPRGSAQPISLLALLLVACGAADRPDSRTGGRPASAAAAVAGAPAQPMAAGTSSQPDGGLTLPPPASVAMPGDNCNQDVDVVFSLDVSGSMTPSLDKLAAEIGTVDVALATKNLPSPPHYGLVIFCDDFRVMNMGKPYPDIEAIKAEVTNQGITAMSDAGRQVDPSTPANMTWPENSLDALYAAATDFAWRPADSTLRIIFHVTDASFWDEMTSSSGAASESQTLGLFSSPVTSEHSYTQTIAALQQQHIWVNAFAAKTGGPPDGLKAPPSHGSSRGISVDVGIGFFEPYMGMKSIPDATGGSAWDLDEVYEGKVSLGQPILSSIEQRQCAHYPTPD